MDRKSFSKLIPDENAARAFLEGLVWKTGRFCPHCGGVRSWAITGKSARPGLYECSECREQFTVTTKTPMHATKLPLTTWLEAIYYILQSSKGVSSVKIGELIGISQKSAWKVCHAVRLLMEKLDFRPLTGTVELDEKYLGGEPRKSRDQDGNPIKHKRGMGTDKQPVFVAVERLGEVRAAVVPGTVSKDTIRPLVEKFVASDANLMTDENSCYIEVGKTYASHLSVKHKGGIYAEGEVHNNTAESFNAILERAKVGVYHWISKPHISRYLAEVTFRWNHREVTRTFTTRKGKIKTVLEARPLLDRLEALFTGMVGKQMRRSKIGGLMVVCS